MRDCNRRLVAAAHRLGGSRHEPPRKKNPGPRTGVFSFVDLIRLSYRRALVRYRDDRLAYSTREETPPLSARRLSG